MPWEKQLNKPGQGPGSMAETYGAGSWAVGRWPVAVNRGPVAADRGQRWPDRDAQPVAVIRRTSRPDRGPRIVDRAHRIGSTGQRIAHPGKRARGPGISGQTAVPGFSASRRAAWPPGSPYRG